MSKIVAIIPARYDSKRFPGKLLEKINGKPIIQLVYERVRQATKVDEIIIATDDQRIIEVCRTFGANAELTFVSHKSGTDRCAQVASEFWGDDIIINVQGDEPFIEPDIIDFLAQKMQDDNWIEIATLCTEIKSNEEKLNPNIVKVIRDIYNKALYFSRAPIPFDRDLSNNSTALRHIGIYAFRNKVLQSITKLPESTLEKIEKLEQLRWLENNYKIHAFETNYQGFGIDTPEDIKKYLSTHKL